MSFCMPATVYTPKIKLSTSVHAGKYFCVCVFLAKNSYLSMSNNLVVMKNSFLTSVHLVCVYGSTNLNSYITFNLNSWWQSNYLFS